MVFGSLREQKQTQSKPIRRSLAGNPKHEARNSKRVEKCYLKKQSQFIGAVYRVMRTAKRKLKKQSQFVRIACCVLRIAERKKAKMHVNLEFIRVHLWLT